MIKTKSCLLFMKLGMDKLIIYEKIGLGDVILDIYQMGSKYVIVKRFC